MLKSLVTRFRAYRLCSAGSSFSYFNGTTFTLLEARYTEDNCESIAREMQVCKKEKIDTLHITSWDQDHCSPSQLTEIIEELKPSKIEYPGYDPSTDCGKESLNIIKSYQKSARSNRPKHYVCVNPPYISGLTNAQRYAYEDIFYHPKYIDPDCSNNNSTVKQFRTGSFNVLSLGDVESSFLSAGLRRQRSISEEVDILILAHHGANNGFTTSSFLKETNPTVAIASSDWGNKFEHPKDEIKRLLNKHEIPLYHTKAGDVLVHSVGGHLGRYRVVNFISGNDAIGEQREFNSKKMTFLNKNLDVLRRVLNPQNKGPR